MIPRSTSSKKQNSSQCSRREFVCAVSVLGALPVVLSREVAAAQDKPDKTIRELFSAQEWEQLSKSTMAMEIDNYFRRGYSCAEAILLVSLRRMGLDESLTCAAAAFGGGLGQKDLCGFLTGACMAFGFAARKSSLEKSEAKKRCSAASKEYWDWWKKQYPLRCSEITVTTEDRAKCRLMAPRLAAKVEELLASFPGALK